MGSLIPEDFEGLATKRTRTGLLTPSTEEFNRSKGVVGLLHHFSFPTSFVYSQSSKQSTN
jgi:hypothetical protein